MDSECAIVVKNMSKSFKTESLHDVNISKYFRNRGSHFENKVLDNISFNIKKGEIIGIIGRNGCGKSTLLSILARIMEPDFGTVERYGKIASILELGMGFHPDMSGRENIYLKGELYGFSKKELDKKIAKLQKAMISLQKKMDKLQVQLLIY